MPQAEPVPETFVHHLLPSPPLNDRPAPQNALTAIIPIQPDAHIELAEHLEKMGQANKGLDRGSNALCDKSPSTHFARFVILNDFEGGFNPHLLFSSNYDGDLSAYMQELVETVGDDLNQIFSMCEGYENGTSHSTEALTAFINQHSFDSQAFYCAFPKKTVSMIRNNRFVYTKLSQVLERISSLELETDLLHIYPYLLKNPTSSQTPKEAKTQSIGPLISAFFRILESWVGIEYSAKPDLSRQLILTSEQKKVLQKIVESDDRFAQNQLTVLVPIKPDFFHRNFLILILFVTRLVLQITQFFASSSVPRLPMIHFARWVVIDRRKFQNSQYSYLLFESNYNQSWDSYIDNLVDLFGPRMNLIWGNCINFPTGGTKDIEWFKQYIRKHQYPAQIFYSAYPDLTVTAIQKHIEIRGAADQFLKLLNRQEVKQFFTGF